ncbi:MAG: arginine--tRNA ligase [Acidobacteriota bacterium]
MLRALKSELSQQLEQVIQSLYGVDHPVTAELAPRRELGDLAFPAPLQLARVLKQNPRQTAQEILAAFEPPAIVDRAEIAGAGYLNFFLDRREIAARMLEVDLLDPSSSEETRSKVVVEHTNINPNKAAHIGHLRNAVLGDVLVRTLRCLGFPVEVQNYIDDTGVQLADVVVGFIDLEGNTYDQVAALPEPFDFHCWDLYSRVGRWYDEHPEHKELRRTTLHELEEGTGPRAEMGRLVARRIVHRHLKTVARIGVGYDLLTMESEVLRRDFFTLAFESLKERGTIRLEAEGKNAGCWVMPLSQSEEFAGLEDPDKVIVRSDGTVTYVGKDIAYQLWKFGLLGRDFHYRRWQEEGVWETAPEGVPGGSENAPEFGKAGRVINVIDNRQSYLQRIVKAGLEALGHTDEAKESIHFAYEMVALSSATARQLGYLDDGADETLEMSGRKGIGVKADDLLDQLVAKSRDEIAQRNRDMAEPELDALARQIATAALRFLMVKATTTRLIAFDLDEALSFEGETGPYLQYSAVRVKNIQRRLADEGLESTVGGDDVRDEAAELWSDDLWDLVFDTLRIEDQVERVGANLELSLLARHALDLAQKFSTFYHRHPILREEDASARRIRLATALVFRRGLEELANLLGIPLPESM